MERFGLSRGAGRLRTRHPAAAAGAAGGDEDPRRAAGARGGARGARGRPRVDATAQVAGPPRAAGRCREVRRRPALADGRAARRRGARRDRAGPVRSRSRWCCPSVAGCARRRATTSTRPRSPIDPVTASWTRCEVRSSQPVVFLDSTRAQLFAACAQPAVRARPGRAADGQARAAGGRGLRRGARWRPRAALRPGQRCRLWLRRAGWRTYVNKKAGKTVLTVPADAPRCCGRHGSHDAPRTGWPSRPATATCWCSRSRSCRRWSGARATS